MKRKEGQDFEDYRKERKQRNDNLKDYLKGRIFFVGGTYNKGKNEAKRQKFDYALKHGQIERVVIK